MFGWGTCSTGLAGAHNYGTVTGVRFLLGVFEAGLFVCEGCLFCVTVLQPWMFLLKQTCYTEGQVANTL